MKSLFSILTITLAAYAQACCAQDMQMNVFSQQHTFHEFQQETVQPAWLIGQAGTPQIMGFAEIVRIRQYQEHSHSVDHVMGFGVHQQITPFLYTQVVVTEQGGSQPSIRVGVAF